MPPRNVPRHSMTTYRTILFIIAKFLYDVTRLFGELPYFGRNIPRIRTYLAEMVN